MCDSPVCNYAKVAFLLSLNHIAYIDPFNPEVRRRLTTVTNCRRWIDHENSRVGYGMRVKKPETPYLTPIQNKKSRLRNYSVL